MALGQRSGFFWNNTSFLVMGGAFLYQGKSRINHVFLDPFLLDLFDIVAHLQFGEKGAVHRFGAGSYPPLSSGIFQCQLCVA